MFTPFCELEATTSSSRQLRWQMGALAHFEIDGSPVSKERDVLIIKLESFTVMTNGLVKILLFVSRIPKLLLLLGDLNPKSLPKCALEIPYNQSHPPISQNPIPTFFAPMASTSPSSSNGFFAICLLHSAVAITCGALMMFYLNEIAAFGHGKETAAKLKGSTPHDQLLIEVSDSFAGLLLFAVGFLLFMIAFVKDRVFQSFFAKGCVLLHVATALWRVTFERRVEELAGDWPRQIVGDFVLAVSWVLFLVYSWREKYD